MESIHGLHPTPKSVCPDPRCVHNGSRGPREDHIPRRTSRFAHRRLQIRWNNPPRLRMFPLNLGSYCRYPWQQREAIYGKKLTVLRCDWPQVNITHRCKMVRVTRLPFALWHFLLHMHGAFLGTFRFIGLYKKFLYTTV